jgi:glutaredoxin
VERARRITARIALALALLAASGARAEEPPSIEVFTRPGCPHCARADAFLDALAERRPLRVLRHDVSRDAAALERLVELTRAAGLPPGVPAFRVGEQVRVGFRDAESSGRELEVLLYGGAAPSPDDAIDAPLVGRLRASELGLPLFSVAVGLVDGFNPCAMWVLLFLLSLLAHLRSRRRMLLVGGVFVAVSGLVYYTFLAAWLGLFLWIGLARPVQVGLGGLAVAMGSLHVKDALWPGRGPSLHIPATARPRIYARVRRILAAEDLGAALLAVAALALFVNLVELLCSAGLPALYTRVLSLHPLPAWSYHAHLALYVVAYVFDDLLMLALAVSVLGARRLSPRGVRALDALSGSLLIGLGLLLALRPEWLMRLV